MSFTYQARVAQQVIWTQSVPHALLDETPAETLAMVVHDRDKPIPQADDEVVLGAEIVLGGWGAAGADWPGGERGRGGGGAHVVLEIIFDSCDR